MESTVCIQDKALDYTSAQTNKQPATLRAHTRLCVYFSCYSQKESDEWVNLSASDAAWHKAVYFPFPLRHCLSAFLSPPVKSNQVCIKLNNALAWNWCLQSKSTPEPVVQEKAIMYTPPLSYPPLPSSLHCCCCSCALCVWVNKHAL